MSRENVETFKLVLETVGELSSGPDSLIALADPEIEWRSFFAALLPTGEYHGHDGLREYVKDLSEAWEDLRVEVDGVLDAGEIVVGLGRIHFRGRSGGVESPSEAGWMMRFRDGRVVRFRAFRDPGAALEAVGLVK